MIFLGFFIMSGLRVNLNVALGAMVNDHHAVVNGRSFIRVRCVSLLLSHALTHTTYADILVIIAS